MTVTRAAQLALVLAAVLAAAGHVDAAGPQLRTYTALTKPMRLKPGEVSNSFHDLPIPKGPIAVYSFAAEVVKEDANGEIVPALLSEVYLHHHVVGSNFAGQDSGEGGEGHVDIANFAKTPALSSPMKHQTIHRGVGFGAGTEARGTPQRFPHPYAFVTDEGEDSWIANVHIINTGPLSEQQAHRCLECPCTSEDEFDLEKQTVNGESFNTDCNGQLVAEGNTRCSLETYYGGLYCCDEGELCLEEAELPHSEPTTFYLQYTVQYAAFTPDVKPLYLAGCCDATGDLEHSGAVEYNVPKCDKTTNPGCIHTAAARQSIGGQSSAFPSSDPDFDDREVDIVFAVGHQHRGGMGIHLYDDKTGETLCESKPHYGTVEGEVGNEKGYIVSMSTCHFNPPLRRRLSDIVRIVSIYDSTEEHTGVMGLFYMALADAVTEEPVLLQLPVQAQQLGESQAEGLQEHAESDLEAIFASLQELASSSKRMGRFTMGQPEVHIYHDSPPPPAASFLLALVCAVGLIAGVVSTLAIVKIHSIRKEASREKAYDSLPDTFILN